MSESLLMNQTALVTGASSGIGRATAHRIAALGGRLILCARRIDRLEEVAQELLAAHDIVVHVMPADARIAADVQRAIDGLPKEWNAIDILVNNAGLARGLRPVYEARLDEVDDMIDTNLKGLIYFIRAVVPGMIERGQGHVVNIGSTAGHEVYPGGVVYCATKHAVSALSTGLKMDLHGTPVRVSSVDPGFAETEFSLVRFEGDTRRAEAVYDGMSPLTADDVADAIIFCLSQPAHVNVSNVLVTPVDQSSVFLINRRSDT